MTYERACKLLDGPGSAKVSTYFFGTKPTGEQAKKLLHWANHLKLYEQGQGKLVSFDDRFCCLGVACDLAVLAGRGKWEGHASYWEYVSPNGERAECDLTQPMNEDFMTAEEVNWFIDMNDDLELSFKEITSFIHHWVKTGFKAKRKMT